MSITAIREPATDMRLVTVTPQQAAQWLTDCNTSNRPINRSRVTQYAAAMSQGLWRHPTGETLIFDWNGNLADGQHRLAAQVQSGVSIQYWVLRGADPADFVIIDSGDRRNTADVLAIRHVPQARSVAAAARMVLQMQTNPDRQWRANTLLKEHVDTFALDNADALVNAVHVARQVWQDTRLPATPYAAVAFWVQRQSPDSEQWQTFQHALRTGAMLSEGSAVLTLRRWATTRQTMSNRQQADVVFIVKAWNAWVQGRPLRLLKWLPTEMPMPLPTAAVY